MIDSLDQFFADQEARVRRKLAIPIPLPPKERAELNEYDPTRRVIVRGSRTAARTIHPRMTELELERELEENGFRIIEGGK